MAFVIPPGKNATLRDAWTKLYGAPKKAGPAEVHKSAPEVKTKAPVVHKKAGKANKPAKKKARAK